MVDRRKSIICLYRDQCPFLRKERRIEKEEKDISNGRGKDGIFTSVAQRKILSIVLFSFISWPKGFPRSQAFHSCNSWYSFNFIEATCRIFSSCSLRRRRQKNSWARIRGTSRRRAYWLEHLFKINSNSHPRTIYRKFNIPSMCY